MKAVFDKNCPEWVNDVDCNKWFLRHAEDYFNDKLRVRGYVSIIDVFNHLTLEYDIERWMNEKFKDICWVYKDDDKIDFGTQVDEENNIFYLNFNIDID